MMVTRGSAVHEDHSAVPGEFTSRPRTAFVHSSPSPMELRVAWSKKMKTKRACVLGLALLATSLVCGGSLAYADALEAESSALLTLAPDANANGAESLDKLHCVLYSDGADNCIVNAQVPVVDQPSSTADKPEPSATEPAPVVQFFDAITVIVAQSVTIAAPGLNPGDSEEPVFTGSIPVPSATET